MKIELYIARRLHFRRDNRHGLSPSIPIAVAGIALAVIVMMVAIAVVLGFKQEIREKVIGFDSQITITAIQTSHEPTDYRTISPIADTDSLRVVLNAVLPPGAKVSLTCSRPAMFKTSTDFLGIALKGISPKSDTSFLQQNLVDGSIPAYVTDSISNDIVISKSMASGLGLNVGDKVDAYFFIADNVRVRKMLIAAIYNSNFSEYDDLYAFCDISLMQHLLGLNANEGSIINITGIDINDIASISDSLAATLSQAYQEKSVSQWYNVDNVLHSGAVYFNWLELLDTNVVVILILMSLISGFTLVSSLVIIILERVNTIGLLKSIGANGSMIRRIFIYLAERLVLLGIVIGNIVAIAIIYLQSSFHIIPLNPEAYYLSYVPIEFNWWYIVLLNICVVLVSLLMLILPSHIIANISPAKTLRYE
jgi:lipoprotein-releasing system permease protein